MDKTTAKLVDYALDTGYADLAPAVVHACKMRLLDTLGCAVGAYDAPVAQSARALAYRYSGTPAATVLGSAQTTSAEMAAFANGVMLRFLDISDMYRVKSGGHPSDVIAPILAVAESVHADGRATLAAIAVAYEIYCGFCDAIDINSKGWDQPVYGVLAAVLAVGKLCGLSRVQMGDAVALALAPNMALIQTRRGELSHWKGCAAANASRNAVFAAALAGDGFTGPTAIFEGRAGVWDAVGKFEWPDFGASPSRVCRTHLKTFPVCYHGQSAVFAALELRGKVRLDDASEIRIEAYRKSVEEMGSDASRWAPATHETADHSLPYVVATALLDGTIGYASFAPEKLTDPRAARLMRMTKVVESPELSARYPVSAPCRLSITSRNGEVVTAHVASPNGHADNPLSEAQIEAKFMTLSRDFCDAVHGRAIVSAISSFEHSADAAEILRLFVRPPASP